MGTIRWIIASLVALGILIGTAQGFAQRNEMPAGYPQSLEPALQALLGRLHEGNPSPGLLVQLSGLLMELPWILGGNEKKAQEYLERAIAADGNYTNARILVAKLYKKQGRIDDAKRQLETVIHADRPHYRFTWERKYKPLAEQMLKELAEPASP